MASSEHHLSEYNIFGEASREKVERLHALTQEYTDNLFTDLTLQNILLNQRYEPDQRPGSYFDLHSNVWSREKNVLHLSFLELAIKKATSPQIYGISEQGLVTQEGYSVKLVEAFQEGWFREHAIVETIRIYQKILQQSFSEFNLQLVLGLISQAKTLVIPKEWGEELVILERIMESWDISSYSDLNSAYYECGRHLLQSAGLEWKKLSKNKYGKNFVLTMEEEKEGLSQQMRR